MDWRSNEAITHIETPSYLAHVDAISLNLSPIRSACMVEAEDHMTNYLLMNGGSLPSQRFIILRGWLSDAKDSGVQ